MLIKNLDVLAGPGLDHVRDTKLRVDGGRFAAVGRGLRQGQGEGVVDGGGLLAFPGFVNAHTHIGDSVGKDVSLGLSVDAKIHPASGLKPRILAATPRGVLIDHMRASCRSMLQKGITTFADFREGGLEGIAMLREALSTVPIRGIILGRVGFYQGMAQIRRDAPLPQDRARELAAILAECDGLGISGANENSSAVLRTYSKAYSRTANLRAIHASETKDSVRRSARMTGRSETSRALELDPHFLVHMTHASRADLRAAAKKTRGIVVCPRANSALAEGIPDIAAMEDAGCTLALGTDNVMVNPPDMFREMDYIWKATMGLRKKRTDPRDILKMATIHGARLLGLDSGAIEPGRLADCVFVERHALDLEPMHEPHAAIVHRASESCIRAVMVGGKVVHGAL